MTLAHLLVHNGWDLTLSTQLGEKIAYHLRPNVQTAPIHDLKRSEHSQARSHASANRTIQFIGGRDSLFQQKQSFPNHSSLDSVDNESSNLLVQHDRDLANRYQQAAHPIHYDGACGRRSHHFHGGQNLGGIEVMRDNEPRLVFKDRKSTRLNSSHTVISYAVFCLKKKKKKKNEQSTI